MRFVKTALSLEHAVMQQFWKDIVGSRPRGIAAGQLSARRISGSLAFLLLAALISGCIERTVSINTEPQGATVFLNDQEVGKSPVKVPFTWYGDYDVIIRKPGYETVHTNCNVKTPWYETPGIDIFTECFMPFTVHDDRDLGTYPLEPRQTPDREALLQAADEARSRTLAGE
jgi:hypothetical protein